MELRRTVPQTSSRVPSLRSVPALMIRRISGVLNRQDARAARWLLLTAQAVLRVKC